MPDRTIQKLFCSCKPILEKRSQPIKNLKAIDALTQCRTRAMGVSYYACPEGHAHWEQYHSCRHRSCFLCADKTRFEWVEQQKRRLYNTPHFHVIFTLPHEYLPLWRYNEALFARLLFKASQQSLLELMATPKHGGLTPGVLMTLHTWSRQLTLHPHTHCLVTAGGLTPADKWQETGEFLLPGKVLGRYYRGKLQSFLKEAYDTQQLALPPDWDDARYWREYRALYRKDWCVRIEERYEHGRGVMLYLARYCKGGPLNPKQIKAWDGSRVELSYLDHRDKRVKRHRLSAVELSQRLLQHVPPEGVHTVRYYGLYAPSAKRRYTVGLMHHGNLEGLRVRRSVDLEAVVLCCKWCGAPARLTGRRWRQLPKGNSLIKRIRTFGAGGSVQPVVERDNERESTFDTS